MRRAPGLRFLSAALTALVFAVLGVASAAGAAPEGQHILGDADCGGAVESLDALVVLRAATGADPLDWCGEEPGACAPGLPPPCMPEWLDTECDHDVDAADALQVLRHVAGLARDPPRGGCPVIGQPVPTPEVSANLECDAVGTVYLEVECHYYTGSTVRETNRAHSWADASVRLGPMALSVAQPPDGWGVSTYGSSGAVFLIFDTPGEREVTLTACAGWVCAEAAATIVVTTP